MAVTRNIQDVSHEWPGDGTPAKVRPPYSKLDSELTKWLRDWMSWVHETHRRGWKNRNDLLIFAVSRTEARDSVGGVRFTSFSRSAASSFVGCSDRQMKKIIDDVSTSDPDSRPAPLTLIARPNGTNSWASCYKFTPTDYAVLGGSAGAITSPEKVACQVKRGGDNFPREGGLSGEVSKPSGEVSDASGEVSAHSGEVGIATPEVDDGIASLSQYPHYPHVPQAAPHVPDPDADDGGDFDIRDMAEAMSDECH